MLNFPPVWTIERPVPENLWASHVQLHREYVISEWYCLNRQTGAVVWEHRSLPRVNYIAGIHEDTVFCVRLGPSRRPVEGACALDLTTGNVLWSDSLVVVSLDEGRATCLNGQLRDLRSGEVRGQVEPPKLSKHWAPHERGFSWAHDRASEVKVTVVESAPGVRTEFRDVIGLGANREVLWHFRPEAQGWHCLNPRHAALERPPYIFWIAGKERGYRYLSVNRIAFVPVRKFLITLNATTGVLEDEIDLGVWTGDPDFGGLDERGGVIRFEERQVCYLEHRSRL